MNVRTRYHYAQVSQFTVNARFKLPVDVFNDQTGERAAKIKPAFTGLPKEYDGFGGCIDQVCAESRAGQRVTR